MPANLFAATFGTTYQEAFSMDTMPKWRFVFTGEDKAVR